MVPPYHFVLGAVGVWRITHMLNAEDGPGAVFARLRRAAGAGFWGQVLDCFYCLSLWVAAPWALELASSWGERWLFWIALSGAASLLERAQPAAAPHYVEEPLRLDASKGEDP